MSISTKVKVKQGTVVGGENILPNGSPYYFFQGIPYAVPPLGELRFKTPVPLEKFSAAEIDCTKEGDVSLQKGEFTGTVSGSEDCLFLNVYTPGKSIGTLLPVMVYIHGGGFTFGNGNSDLYNPLYLLQEGVVVVTMNYRVGVLGFLSYPEGNIPGNAGLKDQRLALQWVKENITQFNGDPCNITLFGHSAGGACVHYHILSLNSQNLFHKAIIQSGLGTMPWAMENEASYKTKQMAQSMGCTSDDPSEIVKFLQNFSDLKEFIKPLIAAQTIDEVFNGSSIPVRPVVEKDSPTAVVTKTAFESMNDENSIDIPVMMGYTSAEGIVLLKVAIDNLEDFDKKLHNFIPSDINLQVDDPKSREAVNLIKQFYFKGENITTNTLDSLKDLLSDFFFIVDTNLTAEIHSRKQHKSPLFLYRFDYDGSLNLYKKIFKMENMKGASHADELFYIFQSKMAPEPWEEKAKKVLQTTCKLWANFAKKSDPNSELLTCVWEPVSKVGDKDNVTLNALIIDEEQTMLENPDKERIAFWRNLRKKFVS